MVVLILLCELGLVVIGLLFVGCVGFVFIVEIGNMKVIEQFFSLEMIGVDLFKYIVVLCLWVGFIFMLLFVVIFSVVGIWGGVMVVVDWLGVYEGLFWVNMQNSVQFIEDVFNGVIKSIVFVFVVIWIVVY